jgi:hypothetical protein
LSIAGSTFGFDVGKEFTSCSVRKSEPVHARKFCESRD